MADNKAPAQIDPMVDTTTVNLSNDITVNGVTYRAGRGTTVPKRQAEDILRMDYDHQKYKDGLMKKHTYETDAGTIAAGGGGE